MNDDYRAEPTPSHRSPGRPSPGQPSPASLSVDAHPPRRIAELVEEVGVGKARMALLPMALLAFLAGVYIAIGAMLYTLVMTDLQAGLGVGRWIGGMAFSLGLVLVVVAGAELFTGNNLIVMALAARKITTRELLRNWSVVYAGNFAGAVAAALLVWAAGTYGIGGGRVAETANAIAAAKAGLPFGEALLRGIACNVLVCLAVWLCYASHSVTDRVLAIVFPIAAFVALGFEHSVANMYFLPVAMLHDAEGVTAAGLIANLLPVTIGNMIGGGAFVAGVYWVIYLRKN
ncbi:formate transporter FocA [Stappia sp. GBMRC 2046]|uniref:Formate transporter FocA n=1 Tax=Stappia sediminis TaxID=2692190 RepID=A0A7X3LWS5_9HYPH|nr:formate/nitrite transporter family protein [Stappia sediminis]MXN66552.1 formate transporter FocA [Stappia sediminis]